LPEPFGSEQRPVLAPAHRPGDVIKDALASEPYGDVVQLDQWRGAVFPGLFFRGRGRGGWRRGNFKFTGQRMLQNGVPGSWRDDSLIADEQQMGGAGRQFVGTVVMSNMGNPARINR
jgi:hypothetical protein